MWQHRAALKATGRYVFGLKVHTLPALQASSSSRKVFVLLMEEAI